MKRLILIIAAALTLTSCWSSSEYGTPKRTQYAKYLFNNVCSSLTMMSHHMQMALNVDSWINEEDAQERLRIEDYYFNDYKLMLGDDGVVTLTNSQASNDYTFATNNTSIYDDQSEWTITTKGEAITLLKTDDLAWSVSSESFGGCKNAALELTLKSKMVDYTTFEVEGSATAAPYYDSPIEQECNYTIVQPLTLTNEYSRYNSSSYSGNISNGTIEFYDVSDTENLAEAKFLSTANGSYQITYRGYCETYYFYSYDIYYY